MRMKAIGPFSCARPLVSPPAGLRAPRWRVRTLELGDQAGVGANLRMLHAEDSKTYAYSVERMLGNLYVVDGLK